MTAIVAGYKCRQHFSVFHQSWGVRVVSPPRTDFSPSAANAFRFVCLHRRFLQTPRWSCATTPRCCGSACTYPGRSWGRSFRSPRATMFTICTTRKRSHQAGSRTSCLSGPMLTRENWCVWMDGRTDEWVLKSEWVNEEMGSITTK